MEQQLISDEDYEVLQNYLNSTQLEHTISTSTELPETVDNTVFCNFVSLKDGYNSIHGWLAMVVCVLGIIFNLANILVLTHRDMKNPVNMILTGIAVADCLVMTEYIPFTIHMWRLADESIPSEETHSFACGIFLVFHINFTVMIHLSSIFLTLTLAIWRFIMIRFHSQAVELCTVTRCKMLLLFAFVVPIFLTIPSGLASLETVYYYNGSSKPSYLPLHTFQSLGTDDMLRINLWLYSVVMKLVPCLVLAVFTSLLIRAMYHAESQHQAMRRASIRPTADGRRESTRTRSTDRTTRLLIALLVLFLIAETPLGILGMLSAIHGKQFYAECYNSLGDFMDLVALVNCATNFLIYCFMSTQFRETLCKMLRRNFEGSNTWTAITNIPMKTTGV